MRAGRQEGSGEECRPALNQWFATMRFRPRNTVSLFCGKGEIRTPEELAPLPLFESGALDQLRHLSMADTLASFADFSKK